MARRTLRRDLGLRGAALALAALAAGCGGVVPSPGGGGPPPPACLAPSDCPGADTTCRSRTCEAGACGVADAAPRTPCAEAGDWLCDGGGSCVECLTELDCPAPPNECAYATCVGSACGSAPLAAGAPAAAQTPNDCRRTVCDGAGGLTSDFDPADVPTSDGNDCTKEECTVLGLTPPVITPVHSPLLDVACDQDGGRYCNVFPGPDGSTVAACVECSLPSQCPGTDGECQVRTCDGTTGACGLAYLDPSTACSTGWHCDGAGGCVP